MYDYKVQYALDKLLVEGYFLPYENIYVLHEKESTGKSELTLTVNFLIRN